MRFFSKLTFICNACFIIAVFLRWIEFNRRTVGNFNGAIKYQPLEATFVIIGYGAIFINVVFFIYCLTWLFKRKFPSLPKWILWFNVLLFPVQVYFFFFSN